MEQMNTICDLVGQLVQKTEEEMPIVKEQMRKENMSIKEMRHEQDFNVWGSEAQKKEKAYKEEQRSAACQLMLSIPFYDDDDSIPLENIIARYSTSKAIIPDLPIEKPDNSLSMGDENLSTIPATESDEVIKSSVENLFPILSELEDTPDKLCDVPPCNNDHVDEFAGELAHIAPIPPGIIEADFDPSDETSSNDDDFEDIEYVNFKEVNNVDREEYEFNLEDVLQVQDVILREKLLNVHRLIAKIESLKDNPTPDRELNSPFSFPIPVVDSDSSLEESDTSFSHSGNSLPEFESFSDHMEETRSGSTTTHANYSLPEYDSFRFEIKPDQGGLINIAISDNSNDPLLELPEFESFHFNLYDEPSIPRPPPKPPDVNFNFEPNTVLKNKVNVFNGDFKDKSIVFQNDEDGDSFTFIIWTFLPFFIYPEESPLFSTRNENTIFDPGITNFTLRAGGISFALPKDN
ncbi:hypothetical protein Tco_0644258 [Tanacetum coccineum]